LQSLLDVAKRDVVISAGWDIATFIQQATNLTGGDVAFAAPVSGSRSSRSRAPAGRSASRRTSPR